MTTRDAEDRSAESSTYLAGVQPHPLPTYQELLDEALELTFPASDPISAGAAARAEQRVSTPMDDTDWELEADSAPEAAHPDDPDAPRAR